MSKTRLTITLDHHLLAQVDRLIDRTTIRNRSHAIEQLLAKAVGHQITTAVILAGGKVSKTEDTLPPLTMINGKPLIQHTLEHLKKYGITRVIITTNSRGSAIQELIGDGGSLGLDIIYVVEPKPLGTAGALLNIKDLLKGELFLVWSGDVLTDINVNDLIDFHRHHQAIATIAVKPRPTHQSYDNVFVQGQTVVDFQPSKAGQEVSIVNAGLYVFSPEIFRSIASGASMLETEVIPKLTKLSKVVAFVFQGMWFDIASDQTYTQFLANESKK